ncbi:MAG: alpha/beta fold hydrolase, partial [Chloroflexi bacterium]|nr:alpha/beta fold hydrolase [Chloroflexota bacterium]
FTVNALALDLRTMAVHDPLGGLADLRAGQLRACSATAFTDDPLRIIRGVRQAAAYGFQIHPETRNAMKQANPGLREVSPERLRDELARMLAGLHQAACLQALDRLGALDAILPELEGLKGMEQPAPHVHDGWQHTVATLAHLEGILSILSPGFDPETANDLFTGMLAQRLGRYRLQLAAHLDESLVPGRSVRSLLSLAAIYHDIAKPPSRSVDESGRLRFLGHDEQGSIIAAARLRALQFSGPEVERVETIIRNHMRVHFHVNRLAREGKPPTRRGLYRFFRDTGQAGVETILLSLADLRATYEETLTQETWAACLDICRLFLENLWEKPKEAVAPPAILDGEGLMKALGLSPGPRVGFLLENIREAQATGKVRSRREALAHGRATLRRIESGQVRESILVDGARLYFFQRPGSGMPLVLLHGFPLDHCIWQPLLPFLPAGAWLLTPDLRGHGLSDSPPGMYTMASMADDLAAILGYLRIRRAVVVGHSMGGYVALAFAQAHTGLLAGLGLVASRATADSAEQRLTRQQLAERVQSEGVQALVDAMLHKMTASSKAAGRVRELFLKTQPAGAAGSLLGMAGRPDTSSLVASLPVPVMLLAGSRDLLIPPEQALCKGIESGTLRRVELPEAGHLPMMEFPAETAGAIARLLREAK